MLSHFLFRLTLRYRHFAESLASFLSPDVDLSAYDWLLRADLDSIVTPDFALWVPEYPVVGTRSENLRFVYGEATTLIIPSSRFTNSGELRRIWV